MYHNFITKENKNSNLYRERRIQHRYQRKNQKSQTLARDFTLKERTPLDFPDQIKTLDYQQSDEWMFSDNKIKNFNHPSSETYQVQSQFSVYQKEKNRKNILPQNSQRLEEMPITPPYQENTSYTPHEAMNFEIADRYCSEDNKINFIGSSIKISKDFQSQQDKRRTNSALDRKKLWKKTSLSMEISHRQENILTPTVFSVKLANPTHIERRIESPRDFKISISSQKEKKRGKSCFVLKEKRVVPPKGDSGEKMKFSINGWQDENPSFYQFYEIDQSPKEQKGRQCQVRGVCTAGGERKGYQRRQLF